MNRKLAKRLTKFPVPDMHQLFVNESLTRYRKRDGNIKYYWIKSGQIFVRNDDGDEAIPIFTENDLIDLGPYAESSLVACV